MSEAFRLYGAADDKFLVIEGDGHLQIRIDFDDVDHDKVERAAEELLHLMNENADKLTGLPRLR